MIMIKNDGPKILETNFWQSDLEREGYFYLSLNAGTARLLVPNVGKTFLKDMRATNYVIISRGPWREASAKDALELLFEDKSNEPFCLHMTSSQVDFLPF